MEIKLQYVKPRYKGLLENIFLTFSHNDDQDQGYTGWTGGASGTPFTFTEGNGVKSTFDPCC